MVLQPYPYSLLSIVPNCSDERSQKNNSFFVRHIMKVIVRQESKMYSHYSILDCIFSWQWHCPRKVEKNFTVSFPLSPSLQAHSNVLRHLLPLLWYKRSAMHW